MKVDMLLTGDWHIPHHLPELDYAIRQMPQAKVFVLMGDIFDFYQVSRYRRDPARLTTFSRELDILQSYLAKVSKKGDTVIYIMGNHELRMRRFLADHAPELLGLPDLEIENLLRLDKYKITPVYDVWTRVNGWWLTHGNYANQNTGKKYLDLVAGKGACGHTHRLRIESKTTLSDQLMWVETGCLCVQPYLVKGMATLTDYARFHNWQTGYVVIHKNRVTLEEVSCSSE